MDHNFDTTQGLVVAAEQGRITAKISTVFLKIVFESHRDVCLRTLCNTWRSQLRGLFSTSGKEGEG